LLLFNAESGVIPQATEPAMNAKDAILTTYDMGERVLNTYLDDLADEDLRTRPVPGQNHIAWQLGHLIASERFMVEAIRPGLSPALPEGFVDAHGRDEASTCSDDPARFLKKDEYRALMKAQRNATKAALENMTEGDLDAPSPERYRNRMPTIGAVMLLIGTHVLMHVGQFVSVRRKLGKPIAI
jgi:hypothetical protein